MMLHAQVLQPALRKAVSSFSVQLICWMSTQNNLVGSFAEFVKSLIQNTVSDIKQPR